MTPTERHEAKLKLERWLSDGESWIGGFENVDLSSASIGRRILRCFDDTEWEKAELDSTRAPDHEGIGLGWRYVLKLKSRDAEEALGWMEDGA